MAIQFPDSDGLPDGYIHPNEDTGVTYQWDSTSNSWLILGSQSVNKNYVDSRDQLRYRRDGADYIYGDVIVKPSSDGTGDDQVKITTDGVIELSNERRFHFSSKGDSNNFGSISYGLDDTPKEVFSFDLTYIYLKTPFKINVTDVPVINYVVNDDEEEVVLFDIDAPAASIQEAKSVIRIGPEQNSIFALRSGNDDHFEMNGRGEVVITQDGQSSFTVRNSGSKASDPPFRVEGQTHRLYASTEYNDGLILGVGTVSNAAGKGTYEMDDDNLIATKGYVDAQQGGPGLPVCADTEEQALPGGFWLNGTNLYIKLY